MAAISELLDKARDKRSHPTDMALAASLNVSRSIVSEWRKGTKHPSDDHVCALARIAGEPAGTWLLVVQAARSTGAAQQAWVALARQLGAAAAIGIVFLATPLLARASVDGPTLTSDALCIMRSVVLAARAAVARFKTLWTSNAECAPLRLACRC